MHMYNLSFFAAAFTESCASPHPVLKGGLAAAFVATNVSSARSVPLQRPLTPYYEAFRFKYAVRARHVERWQH